MTYSHPMTKSVAKEISATKSQIVKQAVAQIRSSAAEYLTFIAATGDTPESIEMRYQDENIWLTQKMMATLYNVEVPTINEHLKKIFDDMELNEEATIRKFRIVQTEGTREVEREVKHYNLQMIIAIGFKVNSAWAVQFRKWVNRIAKDYLIQEWGTVVSPKANLNCAHSVRTIQNRWKSASAACTFGKKPDNEDIEKRIQKKYRLEGAGSNL
jgi:hypothetical protein